ncbi:hypothetical protein B4U80_08398 [Leptotrombidium deliense]|uniref:Uncharacterized protein n=1 Tax=Leptotrombidium deliense TaxID=299467 RepID=A0A443QQN5_9ACAR|nr:hypothetical protein B4U80_08398 [Leptotrombidium deliense]
MIKINGTPQEDGTSVISFGELFQRKDDNVPIFLLRMP